MKLEIKPIFVIQKSDSMAGKAKTEIACSLSWFRHWDAHQRQEFGKLLIEKDQATNQDTSDESIESLLGNLFSRNFFKYDTVQKIEKFTLTKKYFVKSTL